MKTKIIFALILVLTAVLLSGDNHLISAAGEQKRVRFQVTTIGESAGERKILAQTTIEGLPGTDFNINLQIGNFKMEARFLSDLLAEDKLKIRAKLSTRRFYGYSPVNLPLFEEDNQSHILQIGFEETIVLLPFGRSGSSGETLKIEITPTLFSVSEKEASQPLKINFDKQIPSGEISIEAQKIPHNFEVEAVLSADGQEVAKGTANCLLEEESEIVLQPLEAPENEPFLAKITIDKFFRSRPEDLVGISFSFSQADSQPIIRKGAGIAALGGGLSYRVENDNLPKDKNYELRFRIRLGKGEKWD